MAGMRADFLAVRDSKRTDGGVLMLDRDVWHALCGALTKGGTAVVTR
ncbi:DUF397 domain-containing protein [Actinomadura logoneensis]|uniref:DUF397 domain-containing protein n=1 Tax=Actinomadura logoneensis TaxID=2293572 RepID=A0A372JPJ0_9ACTN|nr:DUF397 domain-containing protein [Actinomadura logoneensis]